MTGIIKITLCALLVAFTSYSCRKKEKGNCYCEYYSGDKTHYDLSSLDRQTQKDSCKVIDNNAEAFAGDCELK